MKRKRDELAEAWIGGQRFKARVEQYGEIAYVSVSGGGADNSIKIASPHGHDLMMQVAHGADWNGTPDELATLRMAGAVFANWDPDGAA